jgi:hypothetical protein
LNPFITRDGDVVFEVNFSDVYRSNGRTIVPLVRLGDPAPGGGTLTSLQRDRGVDNLRTDGLADHNHAGNDRPAPAAGSFTALLRPAINDRGQVAFKSEMTGGSAEHGIHPAPSTAFVNRQIATT